MVILHVYIDFQGTCLIRKRNDFTFQRLELVSKTTSHVHYEWHEQ